ncbi:MAG: hypothetical protein ACLFTI_04780 [Anaerolineales bacterium]
MPIREPLRYELQPRRIGAGPSWVTLRLENVGDRHLYDLDVQLHSLDTHVLDVQGQGELISELRPGEMTEISFQVTADARGRLYATIDGQEGQQGQEGQEGKENGTDFHWETPGLQVTVGGAVAELADAYVLSGPYPHIGETLTCEVTVRGLGVSSNLVVEFWVETPRDELRSIAKQGTDVLAAGEEQIYTAEFTPKEKGIYIFHAYLFDGGRRIDHLTDSFTAMP